MLRNSIINLVLKLALCISFLFAALASFVATDVTLSKWPHFMLSAFNEQTLTGLTGILCLALTVWILSGKNKFSSSITSLLLVSITIVFNITSVTFIFSILPLFFISLALSLRYYPRIRVIAQTKITPLESIANDRCDTDVTDLGVTESDTHIEHDQHLFISK